MTDIVIDISGKGESHVDFIFPEGSRKRFNIVTVEIESKVFTDIEI